jgi:CBS domain-containing protein
MQSAKIHRLLVVDDDIVVGIVTTMDIAGAVAHHQLGVRTYVFDKPTLARRIDAPPS